MGLSGRLAITFAALVATTALLVGGTSYLITDQQATNEIDAFLRTRSAEIADGQRARPGDRSGRTNAGPPAQVVLAIEPDAEVQLLAHDGSVVSNSGVRLPVDGSDAIIARQMGPTRLRTETIDGATYRIVTRHLDDGGAVQVARSLEETDRLLSMLRSRLLIVSGTTALLAAGAGWAFAQRTTRPLRSLTRAVDTVAQTNDFAIPVSAAGPDEVGRLANRFAQMLRDLDLSRRQQRRLVEDAAHELRTPLTSIKANIDWLCHAERIDDTTRTQTLAGIRRELSELNDVMTEIIDLATDNYELAPFRAVSLDVVAQDAIDRFRSRSHRSVQLRAHPTWVNGDADSLRRAALNLLSNAGKYSPPDTTIVVEVADGSLFVVDRGPGIPAHQREQIFDRFYRAPADRSQPGSGLGLAIVAGIVQAHGGAVAVDDADHGGTRIGFRIPSISNSQQPIGSVGRGKHSGRRQPDHATRR